MPSPSTRIDPAQLPAKAVEAAETAARLGGSPRTILLDGIGALLEDDEAMTRAFYEHERALRRPPWQTKTERMRAALLAAVQEPER